MKIAVMGSGGWGLAVAITLCKNGHQVTIWSHHEETAEMLRQNGGNPKLLPGVVLPKSIVITSDAACVTGCDIIAIATPSYAVAETCQKILPFAGNAKAFVLLSKGFDKDNGYCLLSQTAERILGAIAPIVALTGPSHAEEVSRGVMTAVVAAGTDIAAAELVQNAFMNPHFRVYTGTDIVSAELGGGMKNIMALAVGISDGAGFGDNTKAMLMTRGIAEMSRLGVLLGGQAHTFSGLSGVGDLIVTCVSNHSRNRRAGLLIGGGASPEEAIKQVGAVVEGYFATEAVHELVKGKNIELPICDAMYALLFENVAIEEVVKRLITRDKRHESDID